MKKHLNKLKSSFIAALLITTPFSSALAGYATIDGQVYPTIAAGNEFDDSGAPLVPAGDFTGVVSIQIETEEGFFICTGSAISKRHIITAAHCVEDATGTGKEIDLSQDNVSILSIFTDGGVLNEVLGSNKVNIHPDYEGFGNCGAGDVGGFFGPTSCLNDDIAIITLSEDIPDGVEIYEFFGGEITADNMFTMVGHGTTGNGYDGFTPGSSSYFDKRFGFNIPEFFDCDDATSVGASGGYSDPDACSILYGNEVEVWYADFDGYDAFLDLIDGAGNGYIDYFCDTFGIGCGNGMTDDLAAAMFEAAIGGGDSGGPSFIYDSVTGKHLLAANNTFGTQGSGPFGIPGAFGEIFGGNLYAPYIAWIDTFVPAPTGLGLILVSLGAFGLRRRCSNAA